MANFLDTFKPLVQPWITAAQKSLTPATPTSSAQLPSAFNASQNPYSQMANSTQSSSLKIPTSSASSSVMDFSKAPALPNNNADLMAQIESVKAQIAQKQKELEVAKAAEVKPVAPVAPTQPEQSSIEKMWSALSGKQTETQQAVQQSQQDLLAQQSAIYEKWGLTPENYQKIQDITTQIGEYQKQISDLDTREQQELLAIENRPGQDIAFMSGQQKQVAKDYAIQRAGIAANASILASQAQALQGNWDNAFKSAQLYVDNATKAQQQVVSDLKWGYENYADIISAMSKSEQDQINNAIKYQSDELDRQQTDYWKQVDADFKAQGLEVEWYKALATGTGGTSAGLAQAVMENPTLFGMFTPTQRANLIPELQRLGFDVSQLQPTTFIGKAKEAIAAFNSSANMLDTIEAMASKVLKAKSASGAWLQAGALTLGTWAKTNPDAMVYNATVSTFRSLLTRAAGEKGVLTQRDVENIQKALPQIGDPEEVWKKKLDNMRALYASIKEGATEAYLGTSTQSGGDNDPLGIR